MAKRKAIAEPKPIVISPDSRGGWYVHEWETGLECRVSRKTRELYGTERRFPELDPVGIVRKVKEDGHHFVLMTRPEPRKPDHVQFLALSTIGLEPEWIVLASTKQLPEWLVPPGECYTNDPWIGLVIALAASRFQELAGHMRV